MFPLRLADPAADRKRRATAKRPLEKLGEPSTGAASGPGEGHYPFPPGGRLWTKRRVRSMDVAAAGRVASPPRCSARRPWPRRGDGRSRHRHHVGRRRGRSRPREPLRGHQGLVPPGATLVGPAPAATSLPLDVTLEPRDPAALAAEVQAVSDPRSPAVPALPDARASSRSEFGPTPATIAQVASALRSEGLTVGTPAATGLSLPVSGTVAQVQSAFATPISKYRLSSGKTGYDNTSAPEVPTSVAPQIEGILGLDTLSPPQPSTSVPEASQAVPHAESDLAAPALAPGQPTPTGTSCTDSIGSVQTSYGRPRRPGAGAGVLVRPALHVERLRGGLDHRPPRDVGGGLLSRRHQHLRRLLRHHARERADHAR